MKRLVSDVHSFKQLVTRANVHVTLRRRHFFFNYNYLVFHPRGLTSSAVTSYHSCKQRHLSSQLSASLRRALAATAVDVDDGAADKKFHFRPTPF